MPQKSGSTGNMVNQFKRHHGFTRKPNAWKDFEELSSLKDERLQKKKKARISGGATKKTDKTFWMRKSKKIYLNIGFKIFHYFLESKLFNDIRKLWKKNAFL